MMGSKQRCFAPLTNVSLVSFVKGFFNTLTSFWALSLFSS
jgi:hypothetical protein